jgi:beta-phosphoglucomutase-like phosphatase (HAD superfamily)
MRRGKRDPVSASQEKHLVSPGEYGARLFDLDGVITDAASVHAAAWKRTFEGYLKEVSKREGRPVQPFEIDPDYYRYMDGKPRYAGVDSLLRSRGIIVDWGNPNDSPGTETVCGLGSRNRVDGNVAAERKLAGKPAPETYEEAARMLGTLP